MKKTLGRYLRAYRRAAGLTEGELAYLIGHENAAVISRLESGGRPPTLRQCLALAVVFGVDVAELFPTLFTEIEDEVVRLAYELHQRLQGDPSATTKVKLDLLERAMTKAARRHRRSRP